MLLVRTTLGPSTIDGAGIGLFAAEPIAAGRMVWRYDALIDHRIPLEQAVPRAAVDPIFRALLSRCAYIGHSDPTTYLWSGDDGRFMNHSPTPNLQVDPDDESTVALRDIAAGEELFVDYDGFCAADPVADWLPGDGVG